MNWTRAEDIQAFKTYAMAGNLYDVERRTLLQFFLHRFDDKFLNATKLKAIWDRAEDDRALFVIKCSRYEKELLLRATHR